ncbi:Sporulation kinase E [bioreactor metagenome]|uniref:histidine kinase n=1 Tax=bioreactor metagenome TaxID=1076179 RepID=A0A645CAV1_9ZZZZ
MYDFIKDAINTISAQITLKNISIELKGCDETQYAMFDLNMIETVIRNLLTNAIKFSNKNSVVQIVVENYDNTHVKISIIDNGIGMNTAKINKLFKIDEKISTKGTENESGTGLGLVLCKEFIEKHGCQIWVESEVGKGSKFSFTLPKIIQIMDM